MLIIIENPTPLVWTIKGLSKAHKDSIIIRTDLETDFVIRNIDETNNIVEVV